MSYQKTIIILIYPTRSSAWALLGAYQVTNSSISPFYNRFYRELEIQVVFGFRALVPGYQMDSYIRASGFVLYPYVFVAGPNKHNTLLVFSLARKFQQV